MLEIVEMKLSFDRFGVMNSTRPRPGFDRFGQKLDFFDDIVGSDLSDIIENLRVFFVSKTLSFKLLKFYFGDEMECLAERGACSC